ncbi:MAG: hypothetical protein B6D46_03685 [Polyangiaceae bacterium UTPRO1]|jgi:hypothetical protein|nr:MAG: hypothetical protein B6D46_03685 [Polyangiaceae bacterium UTPRO1]
MAGRDTSRPTASRSSRYVAILIGVIGGYVVGRMLEDRLPWEHARMLTMPLGGMLAGIVARFTFFRDSPSDR